MRSHPPGRGVDGGAAVAAAELIEEVRRFESRWGEAYVGRDLAALAEILADDYTLTDPLGGTTDKAQNLAFISSTEFRIEDTRSRDVRVRLYGNTAVITALSDFKAHYRGVAVNGSCRYTDVLVRRGGRWYAVASHATLAGSGLMLLLCKRFFGDGAHLLAARLPLAARRALERLAGLAAGRARA
jgi:ketosteroid isomerase-like protein